MSVFPCFFRRPNFDYIPVPFGGWLATVSLFALSAAMSAGPAQAECTQQGIDKTCSGDLGIVDFVVTDSNSSQTVTLTIENATNESISAPASSDSPIWGLTVNTSDYSESSANADLNVDLTGFDLNANLGAGILALTYGNSGEQYSENEGHHDRTGEAGGVGGDAGVVTATISGVNAVSNGANILVQSNGGRGGKGAEGYSTASGDGYGGYGGDGGNGGFISVTVTDSELTQGVGVDVSSTGGEGGDAGRGKAADHTARGGHGGNGGTGGSVVVAVGDLTIQAATGIWAQSLGSNAGDGGEGENTLTSTGDGGGGGVGGNGGGIEVSNKIADGTTGSLEIVVTDGQGILAESIAGSGGNGGDGVVEGYFGHGNGGDGGQGGTAGSVTVEIDTSDSGVAASIAASGDGSSGIVARSYGGAGGEGGSGGGSGGSGGAGAGSGPGQGIYVGYTGQITTNGSLSDGIFAQSVGGFSGDAGASSGIVAYGASSQSAGGGGGVTVKYDGADGPGILTLGDDSDGVFAQSQGGGGGKASSTMGLVSLSGDEDGSSGGNGGALGVTTSGAITTSGTRSRGVVVQSIGGTGGDGGSARGLVSIGGAGGGGGAGGDISANSTADITTSGDDSIAILLQSVGGGGGSAGSTAGILAIGGKGGSGATAGEVGSTIGGTISTAGTGADGVVVQSIGGSGGHGSNTLALSVGFSMAIAGDGGTGNDGSVVNLTTTSGSSVSTQGDNARGISATSVGGGGGYGGNAISVSANYDPSVAVAVGGSGDAGGAGGAVTLDTLGSISTTGGNATAISALSVGGSGGSAGTTVAAAASLGAVSLAVGGDGSGGGDGGQVGVCRGGDPSDGNCNNEETAGNIQTTGDGSAGLYASSVGGGGGQSGAVVSGTVGEGAAIAIGGDGGDGGAGGNISVYSSGGISTSGAVSGALVASSVGGSGGNAHVVGAFGTLGESGLNFAIGGKGGSAKGSGDVTITSTDTISTAGAISPGIQATSQAGGGGSGSGVFSGQGVSSGSANISIGGAGGGGGTAGNVNVTWTGDTLATGDEQSPGIYVMSGAGSGGNAGVTFSGEGVGLATVGVSLGGEGGLGGNAGTASVSAGGQIQTTGFMSDGIAIISQGGNGGRGGMSITGNAVSQGDATVTIGGNGGNGGNAGEASAVTLANSSITTNGSAAAGINVLSLGGNGGQGGMAVETGMNTEFTGDIPVGNANFAFGGGGAHSGTSNQAFVHNSATILTQDFNSPGIQSQSIAGSGGSGGMAISGTINANASEQIDATVVLGGEGGQGGKAGISQVENVADITTLGDNSSGILSQSIGGSGGAGGLTYNILSNFASGGKLSLSFGVTVGGGGGNGGVGGTSSVNNGSLITTSGTSSSGIYAQSIGGNGGSGGFGGTGIYNFGTQTSPPSSSSVSVNLNATVGGSGGGGAVGGAVSVINQGGGHITTAGSGAYGIFAQSVGGTGGDGGLSTNFSQSFAEVPGSPPASDNSNPSKSATVTIKIGGNGGTGADAGTVTVDNDADIKTAGDVAHGIISQSVGGGGGVGGGAATNADSFVTRQIGSNTGDTIQRLRSLYNVSNLKDDFGSFNFSMGGEGGAAGDGASSSVTNTGSISTIGTNAYGIFTQSIGGGGGSGGEAASITDTYALQLGGNGDGGGDGGEVTIVNTGTISTAGYGSTAVFAQSIGAGGGNTGSKTGFSALYDATLAIGGQGGVAGDGGAVKVTYNSGTITTASEQSSGIFAQSVGGGGGTHFGGVGTYSDDAKVSVTVGGVESASGDGGAVSIISAADISTGPTTPGDLNAASIGIFAQSVGGGGGYSGSMILGDSDKIGANVRSSSSSAQGDGGAVTVNSSGMITTRGDNSVGIFAQSVGGAGGVLGTLDKYSTESSYVGSFGGKGAAGVVSVYASNHISTSGAAAHGIFAQFASGEDSTAVAPTTVTVATSGSVSSTGAGAHAIHVENMGPSAGLVEITTGGNSVIKGGGQSIYDNASNGAGVYIHSDKNSTLNNSGTISATSNVAIYSFGGGILTLDNAGTVTGSVSNGSYVAASSEAVVVEADALAPSSIYFDNLTGGLLNAGETLDVTRLRNWGQINVGQAETVSGTRITGDFLQNAGLLRFDVDMLSSNTDLLTVDGEAELRGTLEVNVLQASKYPSGTQTLKIIEASGGVDASELEINPSVVARYSLTAASANELNLSYDVDYANDTLVQALNDNQSGLTTYFNRLYQMGELDEGLAIPLMEVTTVKEYAFVMNTLGPELATMNGVASLYRTLGFADTLFSCPNQGQGNIWADNGQCGYLTFGTNRLDRDATGGASGFTQDGLRIGAGGQMLLDNGLAIGAALAYDSTNLTTDAGASSDGNTFSGGLSVKRFAGNWEFGAAVYASHGSFDNSRSVGAAVASGEQDQWMTGTELRAGYVFDRGDWFFKPRLDLGVTYFGNSSYTEKGSRAALAVGTSSETFAYLRPALEIGGSFLTSRGAEIRPHAIFSMTQFLGNTSFDATAGLANSPASVAPINWQTDIDKTQFDMSAGVTILSANGASYEISAFGHLTDNERGYGALVRVNIPF